MKTLRERGKDQLRRFTQNSLKETGDWIFCIYCKRLNLLPRHANDLTTTIGGRREKSEAGMLSNRLKPHSHSEQDLDPQLQAEVDRLFGEYSGRPGHLNRTLAKNGQF